MIARCSSLISFHTVGIKSWFEDLSSVITNSSLGPTTKIGFYINVVLQVDENPQKTFHWLLPTRALGVKDLKNVNIRDSE